MGKRLYVSSRASSFVESVVVVMGLLKPRQVDVFVQEGCSDRNKSDQVDGESSEANVCIGVSAGESR